MPTSRTLAVLLSAFVALGAAGCAADDGAEDGADDEVAEQEGAIGASPSAAGIKAGSLEEEGVLLLANDRAVTADVLKTRAKLTASASKAIVAGRTGEGGKPRWYASIDELDARPYTTTSAFTKLVADARANGYIEAPDFDPPTKARIAMPDNLGRPPTANDVTVEAGFDGKTPAEVVALVRSRLTNTVDASNDRFLDTTIASTHKTFTLAIGNFFAPNSPHARAAAALAATGFKKLTLLGTPSAVMPTLLMAEAVDRNGVVTQRYYARNPNGGVPGGYQQIDKPNYPIMMRARIRTEATGAQGVRVFYPAWSAKVLSGPTTVIIEGNR